MRNINALVIFIFVVVFTTTYSQEVKPNKSFLLKLIDENVLIIKNKSDKKFMYDTDLVNIQLDTLARYGSDIIFYKFKLGKNEVKILSDDIDVGFKMSICNEYIFAYNIENKRTYKIKGFFGNDLLFLINTIKKSSSDKKSVNRVLKELTALNFGLDFCKMYKSLISFNFNDPNLIICSDGKLANSKD